jgi:hypothetical protein
MADTDETEIYTRIIGENHQYYSGSCIKNTVYFYGLLLEMIQPLPRQIFHSYSAFRISLPCLLYITVFPTIDFRVRAVQ